MSNKIETPYLDMLIVLPPNNDGYVLVDPDNGNLHCGNYGHGEDGLIEVQRAAIAYSWAKNTDLRHLIIRRALYSGGTHLEYMFYKEYLKKKGIPMPFELTCSKGPNSSILYRGEPFLTKAPNTSMFNDAPPIPCTYRIKLIDDDITVPCRDKVVGECDTFDKAIFKAKLYVRDNDIDYLTHSLIIEEDKQGSVKELFNTYKSLDQRFEIFEFKAR